MLIASGRGCGISGGSAGGLYHRVIDSGRGWQYPLDLSGRSTRYRLVPQPLVDGWHGQGIDLGWRSAPAVGGSGATGDVLDGDEALGQVEVVEDAIVADASAPAEAGAFETNDVAGVRVIRHFAERREDARAALRRQSVKLFSRGLCDDEVPGHGGAGRGLRTRRGRPRGGRARGREVRRVSLPPRESVPQ